MLPRIALQEKKRIGIRPLLCTYRLNWARRTPWRWWNEWDDTALQTQDLKLKPWRSDAEHATSRSQRIPTILSVTSGWGRNIFFCTSKNVSISIVARKDRPHIVRKSCSFVQAFKCRMYLIRTSDRQIYGTRAYAEWFIFLDISWMDYMLSRK